MNETRNIVKLRHVFRGYIKNFQMHVDELHQLC